MRKSRMDSRIEIWSREYINFPEERDDNDKNAVILQIYTGRDSEDYIVEVVDEESF